MVTLSHPRFTVLPSPWPPREASHTHGRHTPEDPPTPQHLAPARTCHRWRVGSLRVTDVLVSADAWTSRWVESKHKTDYGKFVLTAGKFYGDVDKDKGERGVDIPSVLGANLCVYSGCASRLLQVYCRGFRVRSGQKSGPFF